MDKKNAAILSLVLIFAMITVPLCADDSEAATSGDISLTLPESGVEPVFITVGNGGTETFRMYVYNTSSDHLVMISSASSDSRYVTMSTTQSSDILQPVGTSEMGHIVIVDVEVSVDRYDDSPVEEGSVMLTFRQMDDPNQIFEIVVDVVVDVDSLYYSADGNNKFLGLFPNTFSGIMGSEWVTVLVTIVVWVVISFIACQIIIPLFTKLFTRGNSDDDRRRIKKMLTNLVMALIVVLSINQCLTILGAGPEIRDSFGTLSSVLYLVIGALMTWTVYVFVISSLIKRMEKGINSVIDTSLIPLFKMIGKIAIAVCAVGSILAIFGVDLNGILVSAGIITLGITLGAQNILNQFFSGIVLLSTRPFRNGDFVKISGEVYIVREVKLMFTEFDNRDMDQIVTIPNNVVSGGTIVNMTSEDKEARAYVYVNVMYGTDVKRAQELMVQAAMEHPHIIKDGSRFMPSTRMIDVSGNAITLRLAAYTDDFDSTGGYEGELRAKIYQLFDENGILLPPNVIGVHIESDGRDANV